MKKQIVFEQIWKRLKIIAVDFRQYELILAHTPHIPADALNLINHMKLHLNGNNYAKYKKGR